MSTSNFGHTSFQRYRIQVLARATQGAYQQTALNSAKAALMRELAFESKPRQGAV